MGSSKTKKIRFVPPKPPPLPLTTPPVPQIDPVQLAEQDKILESRRRKPGGNFVPGATALSTTAPTRAPTILGG